MKRIAILGSTGSIGTQALDVIKANPDSFELEVLTAHSNADLLIQQALEFNPNTIVIANENLYDKVQDALQHTDIKVYAGANALCAVVEMGTVDMVLTAMVGYAGLQPTIRAIKAGKHIALANKETLVVAGQLITDLAKAHGVNIYPVDSEHSAIFQCLSGEFHNPIEKIILTASGGPFRGRTAADLATVTKAQALKHPNWDMGAKITIDSASLMNKGLEVIEAKWLFGLKNEQIEVVVHPQSIIHSLVQFEDGSIKAQLGLPDMKLPIQYALGYPNRLKSDFPRFNFMDYPQLTFEQPDLETFRNLALAFKAMEQGGNMPCILNAANEIAVSAFLRDEVGFLQMSDIIESCMAKVAYIANPSFEDYVTTDREAREKAIQLINN
ncbi:1-deoxy-D-xylulose-5-phosphate reductoisomerase [Pontibacter aydingkolensis]|uniref:1-deoxy-D-xylulose 5-phosphate reductoisomerase n=1 Tax=Pontibacter aydingkolensis TaxID=1911536 RepID=A0ABS7CNT3_9BACT|nr:1-deoxy-D-xylulose-5-phosphate reductoisomerase [Pontibacter aydingkolensis]MBW7465506.1 1-deoxy-D-xylulose-5-phosphate reductoisomerase [Pontibacter aydingkolensis]